MSRIGRGIRRVEQAHPVPSGVLGPVQGQAARQASSTPDATAQATATAAAADAEGGQANHPCAPG
jgi:hypothetical protein